MINYDKIISAAQQRVAVMDLKKAKEVIISCIDHTSLNQADSEASIAKFVESARGLPIASICVYPSMLEAAGVALGESATSLCTVCGAFPSGQTYLEVKLLEVALALENGADEIDIVIDLGAIIEGNYDKARSEIKAIVDEIDGDAILKVIIESGVLPNNEVIFNAAQTAINAGADFVKTSTGKASVGATPIAVAVICSAIKEHFEATGKMVGVKIAGGVRDFDSALLYYAIVEEVLGANWLNSSCFRIGSSNLALL